MQFYLGTTRLQLEHKGGADHIVTSIANVVPAFGFIGIPVIGWLLDRMGYGITLATINFLGVLASFFQAMPSVWFQVRPDPDPCIYPLYDSSFKAILRSVRCWQGSVSKLLECCMLAQIPTSSMQHSSSSISEPLCNMAR